MEHVGTPPLTAPERTEIWGVCYAMLGNSPLISILDGESCHGCVILAEGKHGLHMFGASIFNIFQYHRMKSLPLTIFPECVARVPGSLWGSGG